MASPSGPDGWAAVPAIRDRPGDPAPGADRRQVRGTAGTGRCVAPGIAPAAGRRPSGAPAGRGGIPPGSPSSDGADARHGSPVGPRRSMTGRSPRARAERVRPGALQAAVNHAVVSADVRCMPICMMQNSLAWNQKGIKCVLSIGAPGIPPIGIGAPIGIQSTGPGSPAAMPWAGWPA